MADEQHEWLDKEAAEKMLRRAPVDPSDGPPRNEAERLAAALDAVARTARPAAGELPGEAAALAAFRAVRRTAAGTAPADPDRAAGADVSAESGMLAPVHIRPAGSGTASGAAGFRGPRPMRWSRPIRFGLVASLACCAIGGVAVAAGTGMLPGPFSRHTPTPATSVSAAASPEELGSDLTTDDETSAPPPGSPGGESASPDASRTGGPESGRPDVGGPTPGPNRESDGGDGGDSRSGGAEDKPSAGTGATPSPGGQDGDGTSGGSGDQASWYAKTLKACRDYRDGKLDDERRRRLEALAKGARNLDRFCDRMLDQADGKNDDGAGQSDNGNDEPAGSDGSSGGSGTLPSIGFSTATPEPAATAESSGSSRSSSPSLAAR
ncbi:hypothetical protein [Streptomyces sp. NBC_00385]|uniref:hypothetical protein n=1 Tax=Streptomyces sp. NBC_00385 TaxID=2975733 RepID=UPI002DD8C698|nr:hypothetical protein [Streptomyces sp. NBC_00385]WRZ04346.1 hypothetical protein OG959_13740 [Streptomyces sp. NBC_00385]